MKRTLALLLALLMVLTLVPAMAEGEELRTLTILASYPQSPVTPEEAVVHKYLIEEIEPELTEA